MAKRVTRPGGEEPGRKCRALNKVAHVALSAESLFGVGQYTGTAKEPAHGRTEHAAPRTEKKAAYDAERKDGQHDRHEFDTGPERRLRLRTPFPDGHEPSCSTPTTSRRRARPSRGDGGVPDDPTASTQRPGDQPVNEHVSNEQVDDRVDGAASADGMDSAESWSTAELAEPDTEGDSADVDDDVADLPDQDPQATEPPSLDALAAAVESLRDALAASLRTQEHQQALLDKLHDEKERLREAEQRRQRDPILRDLIQLSDTCLRNSRQWRARGDVSPETAEKVGAVLVEAAADVNLILERQGVEDFAPIVEDKFVRSESKAIGTQPTTDVTLDGLVAEVRKHGYRLGDRVLRFSEVVVWRFELAPRGDDEPR